MNSNINTKVPIIVAVILILILLVAGLGLYKNNTTQNTMTTYPSPSQAMEASPTEIMASTTPMESPSVTAMMSETVTVDLMALAPTTTGQKGTATLKEENGKVMVSLSVSGMTTTNPQPAHIHMGSCPKPGSVVFPLSDVVNGKSETTLNTTMADLKAKLPLAINIHKSASEQSVFTSCGDIKIQ
jgi:hypothetical protein